MASKSSILFLLLHFLHLYPFAMAFDITKILGQFPDYSTFNNLLTQTQLAAEINSQHTITVLAIQNGAIPSITGQSNDDLKKILSLHVILDYFDSEKLQRLSTHTAILTTLFQASGQAAGLHGFLNVTDMKNGQVAFGSAVPGSPLSSNFVRVIVTQPYDISVLQISSVIVPPGMNAGGSNNRSAPTPSPIPYAAPPQVSPTPPLIPAPPTRPPTPAPKMAPAPASWPWKVLPPGASPWKPLPTPGSTMAPAPASWPWKALPPGSSPWKPLPTPSSNMAPAPASWPWKALPPGASPSKPLPTPAPGMAPGPARWPWKVLPPGASPSKPLPTPAPRMAPGPARRPWNVLSPGASPSRPPKSASPAAAPPNVSPSPNQMAPGPSNGASRGVMPLPSGSGAPASSPPAPGGDGTSPAGPPPSYIAGAHGPTSGSGGGGGGFASHGVTVVPSIVVAMGAALLGALLSL